MSKKKLLFTIPGDLLSWNETDGDLIVYLWKGDSHPFWISYKNCRGDVARFKTLTELNEWMRKHIIIPAISISKKI
jgi:hypothetical protein